MSVMPGWKKKVLFCQIEILFKQDSQILSFVKTETMAGLRSENTYLSQKKGIPRSKLKGAPSTEPLKEMATFTKFWYRILHHLFFYDCKQHFEEK